MTTVSFPGLGIGEFTMNPVAFTVPIFGGLSVHWYGIIITCGIILAFLYCAYRCKHEGIAFDHLLDITLFTVIFGVIGARLYYVLMDWDSFDSFYDRIAIWEGGLAIYGGIIAGGLTVLVMCKRKKIPCFKMFDVAAPAVMIGQIVGRWGNFVNGEAYGYEVPTNSPLYFLRMGLSPNEEFGYSMHYFHPTFLYESLWNLTGFLIINALYKKKKFDGQIVLMYLSWYGFGRMFIESLRTDSLPLFGFTGIRVSMLVGFLCFAICTTLLILGLVKTAKQKKQALSIGTEVSENIQETNEAESSKDLEDGTQADPSNRQVSKETIEQRLNDSRSNDENDTTNA